MPLVTKEDEAGAILWSPDFHLEQLKNFKVFNTYPAFKEEGGRETVFHFKLNSKEVWGRPGDESAVRWMLNEALISLKEAKVASTDLVSKVLLFVEEPDFGDFADGNQSFKEEDGKETEKSTRNDSWFKTQMQALRALTTIEGDNPKALAGFQYANGTKQPHVEKLEVSRDSKYLETVTRVASDHIYQANRWSKELTGFTQTKGGIGSNLVTDLFQWKYTTVIQPRQHWWSSRIGEIWNFMFEENIPYGIEFPNAIENLIESEDDTESSGSEEVGEAGQQVPAE
jgi:hypothetical protein